MSCTRLAACFCALALFIAPAVRAEPFTEHLDALQLELEQRLDEDFNGVLDKAAKKQLKAVQVSLKFLAKDADSASDDLKALGKITKKLSKAYPSEFEPGSPDQTLRQLALVATEALRNEALERRAALQLSLPTLSPASVAKKATKLHDAVLDVLADYIEAELTGRIKIVAKATKLLDKADAKVDKADGQGVYLVVATDGGTPIATDAPFAEWNAVSGELQLFGQRVNEFGGVVTVVVVMEGIDGPGSYPFSEGANWSGFYKVGGFNTTKYDIVAGSGSLVLEEFDLEGPVVRGTFGFDVFNAGNGTTLSFPHGAFRLTTIYE